ncbi:putative phage tail assembly chaperone [Shewanella sp. D64]|uniref:putative phage tail assembly chaperone n=1 Tax=unclassified Shewanella TaxID=196818 RepID=UPI0022BA48ED|nr:MULTISPECIES: putative phage tail assembly chaperone [unclassified Shewanella]MEC4725855.1 putative phage tail assembly chaperone [Shewanella sp. D64]MEC4737110.1 putative phage tail assembly chaperone [Shewanella sp. E94]WBJ93566.1 putative phage tail assembly chaperone [Shewanella sp. MTB7]WBJ95698.1 putative phage tail assembly chaperone [Shewanella sp. MTB7]
MTKITLTAAGIDFSFNLTMQAYNRLINGSGKNPAGAVTQLLESTVDPEQKAQLSPFLADNPAAAQIMGEVLIAEFAPRIEVSIKK